jgi:hypothetical protein
MQKQADLTLKALDHHIGTEHYYNVFGVNVTDSVKYVMNNGYSWFVTDAIAALKFKPKLRREPFLTVQLQLTEDHKADMTIIDGNENKLYTQHYEFTDAKRDLTLYFIDNVLLLNSEY